MYDDISAVERFCCADIYIYLRKSWDFVDFYVQADKSRKTWLKLLSRNKLRRKIASALP